MKKINIYHLIVLCCVLSSYFAVITNQYVSIVNIILTVLVIFICTYSLIKNKESIKLINIILLFAGVFITLLSKQPNFISISLIILLSIVMENYKDKIDISFYFKLSLSCFFIVCSLYLLVGFNKDSDTTIWRLANNEVLHRFSLGFIHVNQAMLKWVLIVLASLVFVNKKNIYIITIPATIVSFIIYELTKSRTGIIVIIFAILLIFIFKKSLNNTVPKIIKYTLAVIPLLFLLVSISSIYLEDIAMLNKFFSGRFALYSKYFQMAGITLFGNSYIETHAMLDNSYLHMLLSKGLLFTGLYIIAFPSLVYRCKSLTILDTIVLLSCFIAGLTETILFKFDLILLMLIILFRDKITKKNLITINNT